MLGAQLKRAKTRFILKDIAYLERLGYDTLPALRWLTMRLEGEKRSEAWAGVLRLELRLERALSDWRGWTWMRHRVRD